MKRGFARLSKQARMAYSFHHHAPYRMSRARPRELCVTVQKAFSEIPT